MNQIAIARKDLERMQPQFEAALPAGISAERFSRVVVTALQANPKLLEVDRNTLWQACMRCAQDGLLPDAREASLVIYGNRAQYLPMYGGIIKKLQSSKEIIELYAHLVYEHDEFTFLQGDDEKIIHSPQVFGDRGRFLGAYAIAKTLNRGIYREFLTAEQINKIRSSSRASGKGPWVDWFEEMVKKTVIRRLAKRLPMQEINQVIKSVDEFYSARNEKTGPPKLDNTEDAIESTAEDIL